MEELTARGAGAPDGDGGGARLLGLVELADEGREDVGGLEVEVVAGAVEVGGHGADGVEAVLAPVGLAHLDAGDLGHGVPLIGRFQRTAQQVFFLDRLRGVLGVDAGGAEEQEFAHAGAVGDVDDVGLDEQVVANELGGPGVVGEDAADLGGDEEDVLGADFFEKGVYRRLVGEVEFGVGPGDEVVESGGAQDPADRGTHQTAVAGDVDAGVWLHRDAHSWRSGTAKPALRHSSSRRAGSEAGATSDSVVGACRAIHPPRPSPAFALGAPCAGVGIFISQRSPAAGG
ncbi:hypothetical protein BMS3Bbin12_01776 [bacterium BMS3Bbin12]|nr:hypothetical protein BMS3Bbin12_01776 [bacterium BMS3Bbin12]GBE50622.1 hypothetical protein BMS3Bbin13_01562 [bacterium BMS3Bbin13]